MFEQTAASSRAAYAHEGESIGDQARKQMQYSHWWC